MPAAFEHMASSAVTGAGAPSYTSGAQRWNGMIESLKKKPARIKTTPISPSENTSPSPCAMSWNTIVPVMP